VTHGGYFWLCTLAHAASRSNEPPNRTYWRPYSGNYTPSAWDAKQTYYLGSIVTASDGHNFTGIRESVGQAPPNPTYWAPYIPAPVPLAGQGNWFSETDGQRSRAIAVRIRNSGAGVLQHQISDSGGNTAGLAAVINNTTSSFTTTPTGPDAWVAFLAGGKIGSVSPDVFWVDTPNQRIAETIGVASISLNTTGTPLNVVASIVNVTIHGANANRLAFRVTNAATGEGFALTPANFGGSSGSAVLQISWLGNLSD
jgi:hypothetical protein